MCKLACGMIVFLLLSAIALAEPIQVTIDILPGVCPNEIILGCSSTIRTVILETDDFKISNIDVTSLQLAEVNLSTEGNPGTSARNKVDVDGDGDKDLAIFFPVELLPLVPGEQILVLTGRTRSGKQITGSDVVIGLPLGPPGSRTGAMSAMDPDIATVLGDGGVFIGWNEPPGVPQIDIIGYHVYRGQVACYYGFVPDSAAMGGQVVLSVAPAEAPPSTSPAGVYAHSAIDDTRSRYIETGGLWDDEWIFEGSLASGVRSGETYYYWVTCIYQQSFASYGETDPVYAGRATYLSRPLGMAPAALETVDLSDITFQWKGSKRANEYAIEVSTSPSFARATTWVSTVYHYTGMDGELVSRTFIDVLNNATEFASIAPGTTLYWRVGARNKWDNPGPYPAGPSPAAEGEKNTRYIYNGAENVLSFTVGE